MNPLTMNLWLVLFAQSPAQDESSWRMSESLNVSASSRTHQPHQSPVK